MDNGLLMLLPFLMNNKNNGTNGSLPMEFLMKMMGNCGGDKNGGGHNANINPLLLMMMSMMGGMGGSNKSCNSVGNGKKEEKSGVDISGVFGGDVASILKMYMEYCNPQKNKA